MRRAKVPRAQALALLRIRTAVRRTDVPRLSKSTIKKPTVRTSLCPDGRHSRHPRGMWSIPLPSAPRLLLFIFLPLVYRFARSASSVSLRRIRPCEAKDDASCSPPKSLSSRDRDDARAGWRRSCRPGRCSISCPLPWHPWQPQAYSPPPPHRRGPWRPPAYPQTR